MNINLHLKHVIFVTLVGKTENITTELKLNELKMRI